MYAKPSHLAYLEEYVKLADESGAGRAGLAYRWVRYHSVLKGEYGDVKIVGASNPERLTEALAQIGKGPLDDWILERLKMLEKTIEDDQPVDNFLAYKKLLEV
jgi:aflatoxin B1 aldehyde reductase